MPETALIIEDDREIADLIALNLEDAGIPAAVSTNGRTGLQKALEGRFSLVILDIMLPSIDGLTICRKIREKDPRLPILMLTAKSEETDRVLGLETGADDYLTKPFSVRELVARVKALMRRSSQGMQEPAGSGIGGVATLGGIRMDFQKRKVTVEGRPVELTVTEFDLLAQFVKNPGRAYGRTDLLNLVWGYGFEGYEHTVNSHINRLRSKIEEDPGKPRYLKTVWGVGYRFAEAEELTP